MKRNIMKKLVTFIFLILVNTILPNIFLYAATPSPKPSTSATKSPNPTQTPSNKTPTVSQTVTARPSSTPSIKPTSSPSPTPTPPTYKACQNGYCVEVEGSGQSSCNENQECGHQECLHGSCERVAGAGADRCQSHQECNSHYACDQNKMCVLMIGPGSDQCDPYRSNQCDNEHKACVNEECVLVEGDGPDSCTDWSDCAPHHRACQDSSCTRVRGEGADECSLSDESQDCHHWGCRDRQCVLIAGEGSDTCASDSDCGPTHKVCSVSSDFSRYKSIHCTTAIGTGEDQCSEDSDCGHFICESGNCTVDPSIGVNECEGNRLFQSNENPCQRRVCQNSQCVSVNETGSDECIRHQDCGSHLECDGLECVAKAGAGPDLCLGSQECLHYKCNSEHQCEAVAGSGIDDCYPRYTTNFDDNRPRQECGDTHRVCQSGECVSVPGRAPNECSETTACEKICICECMSVDGEPLAGEDDFQAHPDSTTGCDGIEDGLNNGWPDSTSTPRPSSTPNKSITAIATAIPSPPSTPSCSGFLLSEDGELSDEKVEGHWVCREESVPEPSAASLPQRSSVPQATPSARADNLLRSNLRGLRSKIGRLSAPVKIQMYYDLTCGMCRLAFLRIIPELIPDVFQGKIFLDFVPFPLRSSKEDLKLHKAAECSAAQNKFFEFIDAFYSRESRGIDSNTILSLATRIGVNIDNFTKCLESADNYQLIQKNIRDGNLQGIRGTPTFFINDSEIKGANRDLVINKVREILSKTSNSKESTRTLEPTIF